MLGRLNQWRGRARQTFGLLVAVALFLCPRATAATSGALAAPRPTDPGALQSAFAAASHEFGVPEPILLAVSYSLSRWDDHGGAPSVAGGYGPMHLVSRTARPAVGGRGDDTPRIGSLPAPSPGLDTLEQAAALLKLSPAQLASDPAQNIRGGAALIAQYARSSGAAKPARLGDWYGAVAAYSGASSAAQALGFADTVFATIRKGATRTTSAGQRVALAAQDVVPNRDTARGLALRPAPPDAPECPAGLDCLAVPASHLQNSAADPTDYGNFDFASRPDPGLDLRYIVIHNTEIDYNLTLSTFQTPSTYVSAHYVVRSFDGQVAQMVKTKNVAWHAGNWYINAHAIGIEHEGVAVDGATWYTEAMYQASAQLVRSLAQRYHIPIDRAHILGHDEIPGPTPGLQAGMHWDPGPFWDWAHYMDLLGAPISAEPDRGGQIVTIAPRFAANQPPLTYCYTDETSDCRAVPRQAANFVYLYSAPDFAAPLITNTYLSQDPTLAANWANKAVAGQQFARAARRGDWDAIFFGGQLAWFYNPGYANSAAGHGVLVAARPGLDSIPVYGRAYPESAAYPPGIAPQAITAIYDLPAGERYVVTDSVDGSYYWVPTYATTPEATQRAAVSGETRYYQISFNHRIGFVKASDVVVTTDRPTR
jgi:N-acetyl-anhydromuramyl-L-alanine amidase AmpD